jgi:UDP-glucose 4-epimerase
MNILITGGFGYLGGRIAKSLSENGHQVVLGSRSKQKTPSWLPQAEVVKLVWKEEDSLKSICEEVDIVIHSAGMNAQDCTLDPAAAIEFNGEATARLIRASLAAGASRFIYLSTAHVYCSPLTGKITEESRPSNKHPYATSHIAGEDALLNLTNNNKNFEGIVLRLSNVVGSPIHKNSNCWMLVVNDLCRQVVVDKKMVLRSDKSIERDYLPVTSVSAAVSFAVVQGHLFGGVFNLSSGTTYSLRALTNLIAERALEVLGFCPAIEFGLNSASDSGDLEQLEISNNKLKESGFVIETDLADEIDRLLLDCVNWFLPKL